MSIAKQIEFHLREKRSEEVKRNPVADEFRRTAIDEFDADQWEIFVTLLRRFDFSSDCVSGLEGMCLNLSLRNIDIIR